MTTTVNATQGINPAQGMSLQQLAAHASQLYNQQYNQHYYQYPGQYGQLQQQIYQQAQPLHQWVFDGLPCTIVEFAEKCYGDTAERDVFLLKYTKIGELE